MALLSLLILLLPAPARAAEPAEADWVPVPRGGTPFSDITGDVSVVDATTAPYYDVVGTEPTPALLWYVDDDLVAFRVRVDGDPDGYEGNWKVGLLFDGDGQTADYELAAVLDTDTLSIHSSSRLGGGLVEDTYEPTPLVSWTYPDAAHHGLFTTAGDSTFNGNSDTFAEIRLSRAEFDQWIAFPAFRLAAATGGSPFPFLDADSAGWDPDRGSLLDVLSDTLALDEDGDGLSWTQEYLLGSDPADADSDDDGLTDDAEVEAQTDLTVCDTDGDGLSDGLELGITTASAYTDVTVGCFFADTDSLTTDPTVSDSDAGGWADGFEDLNRDGTVGAWETDPLSGGDDVDSDSDRVVDSLELRCDTSLVDVSTDDDSDNDTILNNEEGFGDTNTDFFPDGPLSDSDSDGFPDFCDEDDDNDGLPSNVEGSGDSDGDGIFDRHERDSDDDGIEDGVEGTGDLDCDGLLDFQDALQDGPCADNDGDGLSNGDEQSCGSNPNQTDSDADGLADPDESCTEDADCDQLPDILDDTDDDRCGADDSQPIDDLGCGSGDKVLDCGSFTGGSCSTAPAEALLFPALGALAILGLRRRRSRTVVVASGLLLSAPAHAYDLGLDVQRFHSAYDGDLTFSRNDPSSHKGLGAGLVFSYANNPLVYRYDDPDATEVAVLSDLLAADLYGSWGFGRVRAGLGLPMYLYSGGAVVPGTTRLGDMHLDVQGVILDRQKSGLGVGVNLNLTLPTGMESAGLGEPVPTVAVDMSVAYGKRWLVQADLGFGTGGGTSLPPDLKWGPSFRWGVAGSIPVGEQLRAVGELDGEVVLPVSGGASTPMEWRIGAIYAPIKPIAVQLAVGTGLGRGIGAPDVRAIAGVAWVPTRSGNRSVVADRDGDGIPVPLDLCPDQAEDVNRVEDKDGCPEGGMTPTKLLVEDSNGALVAGATVRLVEGPETGAWTLAEGGLSRSLPPGDYKVRVEARGFAALEQNLTIPASESFELRLKVQAQEGVGPVDILVTDMDGAPLVAWVRVMGSDRSFSTTTEGKVSGELPLGVNDLWVSAEGYRPVPYRVEVSSSSPATVVVKLPVSSVKVVGNEVQISQKIFFALGSDEIEAVSRVTLDDVAALLLSTPSITRIEIQGHTDDQGPAAQNLELSQRRAEAVANYLIVQHSVNPSRLVARGYGESQPLIPDTTEDARDANRRVVFRVLERDGQPVPDWDSGHRPPRRPRG